MTIDTDGLMKLLEGATPGPWWVQTAEGSPADISHIWRAPPNPDTYKGGFSKSWIATVLRSDYHGDVVSTAPRDAALIVAAVNALPELLAERERMREALKIFLNCAYPACTSIDPRGYSWCESYLDEARPIARAALSGETP